jgi:membrane protease YdiL (CAAX protease family)
MWSEPSLGSHRVEAQLTGCFIDQLLKFRHEENVGKESALAVYQASGDIRLGKQILLHLLPGALVTLIYLLLGSLFSRNGLPSILGFFAASVLVLFPFQIGAPFLLARREGRSISLRHVFLFRDRIPVWQTILLALGSMVWAGLVFTIAGSALVDPIRQALFSWVPAWVDPGSYLLNPEISQSMKVVAWGLGIVFVVFLGPVIEEFYYRSYLLPRMAALRGWAPLVGSVLFALYHFWSPWLFVIRVIAMLPMVYAVWWKRNVWIGILAHCLLNLIGDTLLTLPLVFG